MSSASIIPFLSTLVLAFTVLASAQAKFTAHLTPEAYERQVAEGTIISSASSLLQVSLDTLRKIIGIVDIICGVLLLVPSTRSYGALLALALLTAGLVSRLRSGQSSLPPVFMMALSGLVWLS